MLSFKGFLEHIVYIQLKWKHVHEICANRMHVYRTRLGSWWKDHCPTPEVTLTPWSRKWFAQPFGLIVFQLEHLHYTDLEIAKVLFRSVLTYTLNGWMELRGGLRYGTDMSNLSRHIVVIVAMGWDCVSVEVDLYGRSAHPPHSTWVSSGAVEWYFSAINFT
jgi:hypothetical protein